jgi:hypothetical protein
LNLVNSVYVIFNSVDLFKRRKTKVNYAVEFDIILVFRASFLFDVYVLKPICCLCYKLSYWVHWVEYDNI